MWKCISNTSDLLPCSEMKSQIYIQTRTILVQATKLLWERHVKSSIEVSHESNQERKLRVGNEVRLSASPLYNFLCVDIHLCLMGTTPARPTTSLMSSLALTNALCSFCRCSVSFLGSCPFGFSGNRWDNFDQIDGFCVSTSRMTSCNRNSLLWESGGDIGGERIGISVDDFVINGHILFM